MLLFIDLIPKLRQMTLLLSCLSYLHSKCLYTIYWDQFDECVEIFCRLHEIQIHTVKDTEYFEPKIQFI